MDASQLALYKFDGCPYCQRVQAALQRLGTQIEQRDTQKNDAFRKELIEATGRATVPVLRIQEADGRVRWMPESLDIVRFLEENFGK